MTVKMTAESKLFIEKNLPEFADKEEKTILDALYDMIDEKGFEPPNFHEYNDFGRAAQKVYDDIYFSNP